MKFILVKLTLIMFLLSGCSDDAIAAFGAFGTSYSNAENQRINTINSQRPKTCYYNQVMSTMTCN